MRFNKFFLIGILLTTATAVFGATKFTDLPSLTAANWATGDVFPMVDVSSSLNVKTSVADFDTRYFRKGTDTISNADVNASAAISLSKLAALTANRALQSDASGFVSASTVTSTQLGLLGTATSSNTPSTLVQRDGSGNFSAGTITASLSGNASTATTAGNVTGIVAIANGGTGQTTSTAGFNALSPTTTKGDLIVNNGSNNVRQAVGTDNFVLTADSAQATGIKWAAAASGTVTSVALSAPAELTVGGSPITTSGTLTLTKANQSANTLWAGPTSGGAAQPTFRTFVAADLSTAVVPIANGGTGQTAQTAGFNALSPNTTKGDLIVHNGTNNVRQAVGTNGFVLTADSTQTTGVKWAAAGSSANTPSTYVRLWTSNGYGSTNTKIRRMAAANDILVNNGVDFTYADSATLGASFTIVKAGIYTFNYCDTSNNNGQVFGFTLNSSELTTDIQSTTISTRLTMSQNIADSQQTCASWTGPLAASDVVRPHTDAQPAATDTTRVSMSAAAVFIF